MPPFNMNESIHNDGNPQGASPKPSVDYFQLIAKGLTPDEVHQNTKGIDVIGPESYEKTMQKYRKMDGFKDLSDDQFNGLYKNSLTSYGNYSRGIYENKVADLWQRGEDLSDLVKYDEKTLTSGVDRFGKRTATAEEVAAAKGYYVDENGKQKPYTDHGFWNLFTLPFNEQFRDHALVVDTDKDGSLTLFAKDINDPAIQQSRILSIFGAQPMKEGMAAGFIKSAFSAVPGMISAVGSFVEMGDNVFNMIVHGAPQNDAIKALGRHLEREGFAMTPKISERGQGGMFDNKFTFANTLGNFVGMIFLTKGLGRVIGAAGELGATAKGEAVSHMIANASVFGGLGLNSTNQACKELGVPETDATMLSILTGAADATLGIIAAPKFLMNSTEITAVNDGLVQGTKKLIREALGTEAKESVGQLDKSALMKLGQRIAKLHSEKFDGLSKKLMEPSTYRNAIDQSIQGGMMMGEMAGTEELMHTIEDYRLKLKDPNRKPENMFGQYDPDKNLLENVIARVPTAAGKAFVEGFVGCLAFTPLGVFKKAQDLKPIDVASMGEKGDKIMSKFLSNARKYSTLYDPNYDESGNLIPADKKGEAKRMNDVIADQIEQEYEVAKQLRQAYGLDLPEQIQAMGGDISFVKETLIAGKERMSLEKKIQELTEKNDKDPEIDKLKEQLTEITKRIDYLTKKEVIDGKDSKYTKAFNDTIKSKASIYDLAYASVKEHYHKFFGEESKESVEDVKGFKNDVSKRVALLSGLAPRRPGEEIYGTYASYRNVTEKRDAVKQQIADDIAKKADDTKRNAPIRKKFLKDLKDIEVPEKIDDESISKFADNMDRLLETLEPQDGVHDILSTHDFSNDKKLKEAVLDKIDTFLDKANNTNPDDIAEDELRRGQLKLRREQTRDKYNSLLSRTQPELDPSDNGVMKRLFVDDIANTIGVKRNEGELYPDGDKSLMAQMNAGFPNRDQSKARVAEMRESINDRLAALDLMPFLRDKKFDDNRNDLDLILSDTDIKKYKDALEKLDADLGLIEYSLQTSEQQSGHDQHRFEIQHQQKTAWVLQSISSTLSFIPGFTAAIEDLGKSIDYDATSLDPKGDITDATIKKVDENAKKIVKIKKMIFDSSVETDDAKNLFSKKNRKELVSFISGLLEGGYLQGYETCYEVDANLAIKDLLSNMARTKEEGFTNSDFGYMYTVNFLTECVGADPVRMLNAQALKRKHFMSDNLSAYEQQNNINMMLSFVQDNGKEGTEPGNATKMIQLVQEAEKDNAKRKGEGYSTNWNPYFLFVRGMYKTGKSTQQFRDFVLMHRFYGNKSLKLSLIGISPKNLDILESSLKDVNKDIDNDKYNHYTLEVTRNRTYEYLNGSKKADILKADCVIWDEATLIPEEAVKQISKSLKDVTGKPKFVFFGDDSQMSDIKQVSTIPTIDLRSMRTLPTFRRFGMDNPMVTMLAETYRGEKEGVFKRERMWSQKVEGKPNELEGGHYYENADKVIEAYNKSTSSSKMLIVVDNDHLNTVRAKIDEKALDGVYTITTILDRELSGNEVNSAQGLRASEVYIAFDVGDIKAAGGNWKSGSKAMYTAIGRSSSFVGVFNADYKNLNLSSKPVDYTGSFESQKLTPEQLSEEIKRRDGIAKDVVGKDYEGGDLKEATQSAKTTREMPVTKLTDGVEYHVTSGDKYVGDDVVYNAIIDKLVVKHYNDDNKSWTETPISKDDIDLENLSYVNQHDSKVNEPDQPKKKDEDKPKSANGLRKEVDFDDVTTEEWRKGHKSVYASSYYIVSTVNDKFNDVDPELKRRLVPELLVHINTFFTPELVLIRDGWTDSGTGAGPVKAKDFLIVRLKSKFTDGGKQFLEILGRKVSKDDFKAISKYFGKGKANDLPDELKTILYLGSYEAGKGKHIDARDLDDAKTRIEHDFKGDSSVDPKNKPEMIARNIHLADIILTSIKNNPGLKEIPISEIRIGDKFKSLCKTSKEVTPIHQFIQLLKDKVNFDVVRQQKGLGKNDRLYAYLLDYSFPGYIGAKSHVVLRAAKFSEVKNGKKLFIERLDEHDKNHENENTSYRNQSPLTELLKSNHSVIMNDPAHKDLKTLILQYGSYAEGGKWFNYSEKGKEEQGNKNYDALREELFGGGKDKFNLLKDLELPIPYLGDEMSHTELANEPNNPLDQIMAMAPLDIDAIHAPFTYVPLDGVEPAKDLSTKPISTERPGEKKEDTTIKATDLGTKPPAKPTNTDYLNQGKKTLTKPPKDNAIRVSLDDVAILANKIMGDKAWKQIKKHGIKPQIWDKDYGWLYGYMQDGKIKLEMTDKGIAITAPKHEFFHLVFNYFIDGDSRSILDAEARKAMAEESVWKGKDISTNDAEEWMAKKYGATGLDINTTMPKESWWMKYPVLRDFIQFVQKIFGVYKASTYQMDKLMYNIDNGKYRDLTPNIEGSHISRKRMAYEEETEQESVDSSAEDDGPHTSAKEFYNTKMTDIYGRKERADVFERILHGMFKDFGNLGPYKDTKYGTFPEIVSRVYSKVQEIAKEIKAANHPTGIKDINGKEMNVSDIDTFNELRSNLGTAIDPDLQQAWEWHNLAKKEVFDAFLSHMYKHLNTDAMDIVKDSTSTQFERKKNYNPEWSKTDQIRHELYVTPYYEFDENGRIVAGTGEDFVSVKDLESSLGQAGELGWQLYRDNPGKYPSEKEAFIDAIRSLADEVKYDNKRRNNLLSFHHRFFDRTNPIALDWMSKELFTSDFSRHVDIENFITALTNIYTGYTFVKRSMLKVSHSNDKDEDKFYNYVRYARNTAEDEKNKIVDSMKMRLFFNGQVGDKARQNIGLTGKDAIFDVREDGLYYVKGPFAGKHAVKLIHAELKGKDWVTSFTGEDGFNSSGKEKFLNEITSILGLGDVNHHVWGAFLDSDRMSNSLKSLIKEYKLKNISSNYNTENFLSDFFMNMFWSLESNSRLTDDVVKAMNKYGYSEKEQKLEDKDLMALEADIVRLQSDVKYKDQMGTFQNKMGMSAGTFDGMPSVADVSEANYIADIFAPKPTDYFNAFNLIAVAHTYIQGLDAAMFHYSPENKMIYNRSEHNKVSRNLDGGSRWMISDFNQRILSGDATNSVYYDPITKKILNGLYDPNGVEVLEIDNYSGAKFNNAGTDSPGIHDLVNMIFTGFFDTIKKGGNNKFQKIIVPMGVFGDKGDVKNSVSVLNTGSSDTRILELKYKGKKLVGAEVVGEYVFTREVERKFNYHQRVHEQSLKRWNDFLAANEDLLELFPKHIYSNKTGIFNPDDATLYTKNKDGGSDRLTIELDPVQRMRLVSWSKGDNTGLVNNLDYELDERSDGGATLTLGNALLWKVPGWQKPDAPIKRGEKQKQGVYTYKNYKLHSKGGVFKLSIKDRDGMFEDAYKDMCAVFAKDAGFGQPEDVRNLLKEKDEDVDEKVGGYFISSKTRGGKPDWNAPILKWNPVYKAFFYAHHVVNNAIGDDMFGSTMHMKNPTTKAKRMSPAATPMTHFNTSAKYGLGKWCREIVVNDNYIKDDNVNDHIETVNGGVHMSMLFESFMRSSFGDHDYGPFDKTMYKTLSHQRNMYNGGIELRKEASDAYSSDLFDNNITLQNIQYRMLETMDRELKERYGDFYKHNLVQKFREYYAESKSAQKAFDKLKYWIVDESGMGDQIKEMVPMGLRYLSSHKGNVDTVNTYDPTGIQENIMLKSRPMDLRSAGIVLNPSQSISAKHNLSPMNQVLAMIGMGKNNQKAGERMNRHLGMLYEIGMKKIDDEIDKESSSLKGKKAFYEKFEKFMRKRGLSIIKSMSTQENFAELLKDDRVPIDTPQVLRVLTDSYRNYINENAIKVSFDGLRLNNSSGYVIDVYELDGATYTLKDLENRLGVTYFGNEQKFLSLMTASGIKRRSLIGMQKGAADKRGEVAMPFMHRKEFGLNNGESLADVYTLYYTQRPVGGDGKMWVDLRTKPKEQRDALITQALADGIVDTEKTLMFKNADLWGGWKKYIDGFEKTLNIYASRVPADSIGSGGIGKIVQFAEGNGNVLYLDPRMNNLSNADFDIDQSSTYIYSLKKDKDGKYYIPTNDTKEGLHNKMIDEIFGVYTDPLNEDHLFVKSTTKSLIKAANELQSKSESLHRDNDIGSFVQIYREMMEGSEGISIMANTLSSYYMLSRIEDPKILKEFSGIKDTVDIYGAESKSRKLGMFLQTLLDNAKELVVGRLGVTMDSIPILGAFVIDHKGTAAELPYDIHEFFTDKRIQQVFKKVSIGNSIEESKRDHRIFDMIRDVTSQLNDLPLQESPESKKKTVEEVVVDAQQQMETLLNQVRSIENEVRMKIRKIKGLDEKTFITKFEQQRDYGAYPELAQDEVNVNKLLGEYRALQDRINDTISRQRLEQLRKYAAQAEMLRRVSMVVDLRNGIKVDDFEFDQRLNSFELSFGQPVKDFIDGVPVSEADKEKFFLERSNEAHYYKTSQTHLDHLLADEKLINDQLDFNAFVHSFKHFEKYLGEYDKQKELFDNATWQGHQFLKDQDTDLLKKQNLGSWDFANRFYGYRKTHEWFLLDYFFKHFYSPEFNLNLPEESRNNELFLPGLQSFKSLNLSKISERNMFKKIVPLFHEFLKSTSKKPVEEQKRVLELIIPGRDKMSAEKLEAEVNRLQKAITDNSFLNNIRQAGKQEAPMLELLDKNLTPQDIAHYNEHLKRLPEWIQEVYIFNQLLNTGFTYKSGGIIDIIGTDIYTRNNGLGDAMRAFRGHMDSIENNKKLKEQLQKEFNEWALTKKGVSSYLSSSLKKLGYRQTGIIEHDYNGLYSIPVVKIYDPLDKRSNKTGYVKIAARYPVGFGSELIGFDDKVGGNTTRLGVIRLTAQEIDQLLQNQDSPISRPYPQGHSYHAGMQLWSDAGIQLEVDYADRANIRLSKADKNEIDITRENTLQQFQKDLIDLTRKTTTASYLDEKLGSTYKEASSTLAKLYGLKESDLDVIFTFDGEKHLKLRDILLLTHITNEQDMIAEEQSDHEPGTKEYAALQKQYDAIEKWLQDNGAHFEKTPFSGGDKKSGYEYYHSEAEQFLDDVLPIYRNYKSNKFKLDKYYKKQGVISENLRYVPREFDGNVVYDEDQSKWSVLQKENSIYPFYQSKFLRKFKTLEGQRMTQQMFQTIISRIEEQFPQFSFIPIDGEGAKELGYDQNIRGFIEGNKVYYNTDRIRLASGIHELQHIWNKVYSVTHPIEYKKFESFIRDQINSETQNDIKRLAHEISINYPELKNNESKLVDEVLATVGGFVSVPAAERFLRDKNSFYYGEDRTFAQRLVDMVAEPVKKLWSWLKDIFGLRPEFNINNPDLKQYYTDFIDQVFHGDKFQFSEEQMRMFDYMRAQSKPLGNRQTNISILTDLIPYMSHADLDPGKVSEITKERQLDILSKKIRSHVYGDNYYYHLGNKSYKFPIAEYKDRPDLLRKKIEEEILPKLNTVRSNIKKFVQQFVEAQKKEIPASRKRLTQEIYSVAEDIFGKEYINTSTIQDMISHFGLFNEVKEVLKYSDLKNHKDKNLRSLYMDGFEGFDPLILVHNTDGTPDISILDITSDFIGEKTGDAWTKNIFGSWMTNEQYKRDGLPARGWNDKLYSMRKLVMLLQIASMKRLSPDVRFRATGVYETNGTFFKAHPISDIQYDMNLIKKMSENSNLRGLIKNPNITAIFDDKTLFDKDYKQSAITQANQWIADLADNGEAPYSVQTTATLQANKLFSKDVSRKEIEKIYRKRMADLERQYKQEDLDHNEEYAILANAIHELRGYYQVNDLSDMTRLGKRWLLPIMSSSDAVQFIMNESQIAMNIIINRFENEYHKKISGDQSVLKPIMKMFYHSATMPLAAFKDVGTHAYRIMYKKVPIRVGRDIVMNGKKIAAGTIIEHEIPVLHVNENDPDTMRAIPDAEIRRTVCEASKGILKMMKECMVRNIYTENVYKVSSSRGHVDELGNATYTMEDAEKQFNEMFPNVTYGMIPTIERSSSDLIMSPDILEGVRKASRNLQREGEYFTDEFANSEILSLVSSALSQQRNPDKILEKVGLQHAEVLKPGDPVYEVMDGHKLGMMSTNIERMARYTALQSLREEVLTKDVLPLYNVANSILHGIDAKSTKQTVTKEFMEELMNRFLFRKNIDSDAGNDIPITIFGHTFHVSTIARGIMYGFTNLLVFAKPVITAKVVISDEFRRMTISVASEIAHIGVPKGQEDRFPGIKEWALAFEKMVTDPRKAWAIAKRYNMVNRSERSLIQDPMWNLSKRYNSLQEYWGFVSHTFGDASSRSAGAFSWMLKEGSWDAFTLNEKTAELVYDEHKDRRFYGEDGKSQTVEQKAAYAGLRQRLIDQGQMKPEDKELPIGHDWELVANNLQWFGERFIMSSMSPFSKSLAGNWWASACVSQFRGFTFGPIFNAIGSKRKTIGGAKYSSVTLGDGSVVSTREYMESVGYVQSVSGALKDLLNMRKKGFKWEDLKEEQRVNIGVAIMKVSTAAVLMFLLSLLRGDDKKLTKSQESKFASLYTDIFAEKAPLAMLKSPVPAASAAIDMFNIVVGNKDFNKILKFTGPVGGIMDVVSPSN